MNIIVDAAARSIAAYFEEAVIYTDTVMQGFKMPCFFVKISDVEKQYAFGPRFRMTYTVEIRYYTSEKVDSKFQEQAQSTAEKLYQALEIISCDSGNVRARETRHKFEEGILYFYAVYSFHMEKSDDTPLMKSLADRLSTKGW